MQASLACRQPLHSQWAIGQGVQACLAADAGRQPNLSSRRPPISTHQQRGGTRIQASASQRPQVSKVQAQPILQHSSSAGVQHDAQQQLGQLRGDELRQAGIWAVVQGWSAGCGHVQRHT